MTDTAPVADRLDLMDVYARYAIGMDRGDRETFASAWAPDAIWICEELKLELHGIDEILAWFDKGPGQAPRLPDVGGNLRLCGNQLVVIDGDRATGRAEFVAYRYTGSVVHPYTAGHYVDEFARTPAGWRLIRRNMVVTPFVPNPPAVASPSAA